jgi:hypothetical protein
MKISDFYKASTKERLNFFLENKEDAFNMLQDVVEYLVLEDEGLFPEDGEIAFS